jgi:hypothetical protein
VVRADRDRLDDARGVVDAGGRRAPDDSSRLAVASWVCTRPYAETLSCAATGGFKARIRSASSATSLELVSCCAVIAASRCLNA